MLIEEKRATLNDLHRVSGKAELIGGRIVELMSTGKRPARISGAIYIAIHEFLLKSKRGGEVFVDNTGYAVPELPSGRESFSPDVSYFDGPEQADDMDFIQGAPAFAVEIRSKDGYGPGADENIAAKRADYFQAGARVVWDVDTKAECIHAYSANTPQRAKTFHHGDFADAELALPGFRVEVSRIFDFK